jgi:bifunctional non-homologous end joining protein LigD
MEKSSMTVNERDIPLSNLKKVLYPWQGFTKLQVLEYYIRAAPFMLPHLKDRALTLKRYPDGVEEDYFFEKRCPKYSPKWVKTAEVPYGAGKHMRVCLADDLQTLIWVENLASIELHVPQCRASSPLSPDSVVFDLDPGEGAGVLECAKVALILREMLSGMKLESVVKTSGKKGLHAFVPVNSKGYTFDDTKNFSRAIAAIIQKNYPALVTSKMDKVLRVKKVFINWSQNDASKTMVAAYSLRADTAPSVSMPLDWKQLKKLSGQSDPRKFFFTPEQAVAEAEKSGDIFRPMLDKKQKLPSL